MSAQGPDPTASPAGRPPSPLPGLDNGWSVTPPSPVAEELDGPEQHRGPTARPPAGPSPWAPPGTPAPPPPPASRRNLVATAALAVVVTLAGLVGVGWWLTTGAQDTAAEQPPVAPEEAAPPARDLLPALDAAGLHCVVEVVQPEQHACFALEPEEWAEVHWVVHEDRVDGLRVSVDHTSTTASTAGRVVAALVVGLGLPDADRVALDAALDALRDAAEDAEPVAVDTSWGSFELSPGGDGWVDLSGLRHGASARTHPGKDFGVAPDAATARAEELGYRCEPVDEAEDAWYGYVGCDSGSHQLQLTSADGRLVAVQVTDAADHADVVSALLALAPSAERAVLEQMHQGLEDQPSVQARADWVMVHNAGWLWVGAGSW